MEIFTLIGLLEFPSVSRASDRAKLHCFHLLSSPYQLEARNEETIFDIAKVLNCVLLYCTGSLLPKLKNSSSSSFTFCALEQAWRFPSQNISAMSGKMGSLVLDQSPFD